MKIDDIIINKTDSIKKCVARAKEEYDSAVAIDRGEFSKNFSKQDAAMLNILRACEQTIDLANYMVRKLKLGTPNDSRDSFGFLANANVISADLEKRMKKMIGLRNICIHEYDKIDIGIIESVINKNLNDLIKFTDKILTIINS